MHFKGIKETELYKCKVALEIKWLFVKLLSSNPWHKLKLELGFWERISLDIYAVLFLHLLEPPVVSCTCLLLGDLLQLRVRMCSLAAWVELLLFKTDYMGKKNILQVRAREREKVAWIYCFSSPMTIIKVNIKVLVFPHCTPQQWLLFHFHPTSSKVASISSLIAFRTCSLKRKSAVAREVVSNAWWAFVSSSHNNYNMHL